MPINYGQGFNEAGNRMNIESITDRQGRNVFGTMGGDPYSFDPYNSPLPGQFGDYLRLGADPQELMNTGSFYPQAGFNPSMAKYDETYGWMAPKSVMDQRNNLVSQSGVLGQPDFMSKYGPALVGSLVGAGIFSGMGGFSGLGAEAGGAGWSGGFDGIAGDSLANWGGQNAFGSGLSGGFPPESYWNSFASNGTGNTMTDAGFQGGGGNFNTIDFNNFQNPLTSNGSNPFANVGDGAAQYNPSQWDTSGFSSANGGGLANSITPSFLSQAGGAPLAGMNGAAASGAGISGLSANGTSFMDMLGNVLGKPQIPGMPNSTGGNLATSLANYFIQSQRQSQLQDAATQSANLNNPMNQAQRLPFQAAYANLMLNPNSYQQTPYAQGMTNQVNQAFQANVGKYGPSGTVFSDYLKNYQNVLGQDYFKLAGELGMAGGFNQGTGGAGTAYGNLAGQAANAGSSAFEGFGKLFSNAGSASNDSKPFQPTENPTGSVTYSG